VDAHNLPDVTIENVFGMIVLGLNHFVPGPELPAEFFQDRLIGTGRVKLVLEPDVQFAHAQ
jgi:hypothetical protein